MVAERRTDNMSTLALIPVISVVAPVYNEEETLPHFYRRMIDVLETLHEPFELLLVNDGSVDHSYEVMRDLQQRDARVRVINFSRNFGHQPAISAGMAYARGKAVVIIDSDLQDPPEVIPELFDRWRKGAEVVYAQRAARAGETRFKLISAGLFYRLDRADHRGVHSARYRRLPAPGPQSGRCPFRAARASPLHARPFRRGWVSGRKLCAMSGRSVSPAPTKYPLRKMIRFSLDAITGFSFAPLQLATTLGFLLAGLSLLAILIAALLRLTTGAIVGQATTLILVLFLGGIQLIFLGIIGEYLGRIYDEVRGRPLYIVHDVLEIPEP